MELRERLELGEQCVRFVHRLRRLGVSIGIDQTRLFIDSVALIDPFDGLQFRATARATLVTRAEDLPILEDALREHFGVAATRPRKMPRAPRHRPLTQKTALTSFLSADASSNKCVDVDSRALTANREEALVSKSFSMLTAEERSQVERTLRAMSWDFCERRSRRWKSSRNGPRVDFRTVVRRRAQSGTFAFALPLRHRKLKARPLVLIADISGSMELYSRIVLQLFHGIRHRRDTVEAFVFGTRLTRVTDELGRRDIDVALDALAGSVPDFAGGTRIGECLRALQFQHPSAFRPGCVVLLVSDGCEVGDAGELERQLLRLRHRSHRLIFLNPHLSDAEYRPAVKGMQVVLRCVDDLLPVGDLRSLRRLNLYLSNLPRRRGGRRFPHLGDIGETQR